VVVVKDIMVIMVVDLLVMLQLLVVMLVHQEEVLDYK
tara:strand:- start:304 stop:414 length:111 start_codon:yes stop_codon:yes gene_type:complete